MRSSYDECMEQVYSESRGVRRSHNCRIYEAWSGYDVSTFVGIISCRLLFSVIFVSVIFIVIVGVFELFLSCF